MAAGLLELEGQVDGSVDSSPQAVDVQLLKAMGTCIQLRGVPCKHMYMYIITCIDIDIAYTPHTGEDNRHGKKWLKNRKISNYRFKLYIYMYM